MGQGLCKAEVEATFVASQFCIQEKQNHAFFQNLMDEVHSHNQKANCENGDYLAVGFPNHASNLYQFAQIGLMFRIVGTQKSVEGFLGSEGVRRILNTWMVSVPNVSSATFGPLVFYRDRNDFKKPTVAQWRRLVKKDERFVKKLSEKNEVPSSKLLSAMKVRKKVLLALEDILSGKSKEELMLKHAKTHLNRAYGILTNRPQNGALNQGKVLLKIGATKASQTKKPQYTYCDDCAFFTDARLCLCIGPTIPTVLPKIWLWRHGATGL